jgi:uncharacterized damage-inducible protein DinB
MSLQVPFEQLLDYSDHERGKWRDWIAADPERLDITVQAGARFPTIGTLLDHIFFVERRHLCRLEGSTPPDQSGIPPGDWTRLFEYGDLVRADLRRYVADLDERTAIEPWRFTLTIGDFQMTRRRLLTHILLHEVRHYAQIALAARAAGVEPPGEHDIMFFAET